MATLGPDPAPWYLDALKACGRDPANFNIAQLRLVYVAQSEDQAWEDAQEHLHSMMDFYREILVEANDAPGDEMIWPFKDAKEIRHSAFGQAVMIGTPDQVARKMERFCQEFRCTHFIMSTQLAGMDPRKGTRAMELFAKEVLPSFRKV